MKPIYALGSPQWIEDVFESPPVRNTRGPSKHTSHHDWFDESLDRYIGGQGRPEACASLLLRYLRVLGMVTRFKEQPFETSKGEFGAEITPDFFVETAAHNLIVVESKTYRYVTREVEAKLDANRRKFAEFGLPYVVWTTRHPLNHALRHNLINMAKSDSTPMPESELHALQSFVGEHPRGVSLQRLYDHGFDWDIARKAANQGLIFFPIWEAMTETSVFSPMCVEDLAARFLATTPIVQPWWNSL